MSESNRAEIINAGPIIVGMEGLTVSIKWSRFKASEGDRAMSNLTSIECQAIQGIIDSDFRDGNDPVGCAVWSWSCNPFDSKKIFSGAVSSLVKKGYVKADGYGDDACLTLTQSGYDAFKNNT